MNKTTTKLRDLNWKDRQYFYSWINDVDVIRYSLTKFQKLKTKQQIDDWFKGVLEDKKSFNKGIVFNDSLIGYAGIASIKKQNKSGEYFIFIGDKDSWGKGIGTDITKRFIKIAFEELNLNRLSLTVSDLNQYGLRAYKSAGFIEEGRLRQAAFRDGDYHDKIVMSVIRDDLR